MNYCFIIPDAFAQEHNGKSSTLAPDQFASAKLKDGNWAVGYNAISSFPELFVGKNFLMRDVADSEYLTEDQGLNFVGKLRQSWTATKNFVTKPFAQNAD
jgi:hypothetical protein